MYAYWYEIGILRLTGILGLVRCLINFKSTKEMSQLSLVESKSVNNAISEVCLQRLRDYRLRMIIGSSFSAHFLINLLKNLTDLALTYQHVQQRQNNSYWLKMNQMNYWKKLNLGVLTEKLHFTNSACMDISSPLNTGRGINVFCVGQIILYCFK